MRGVITTTGGVDLWPHFSGVFAEDAPELTVFQREDISDPAQVDFVFTFIPPDDLFEGMTGLKAIFSAGAGTDAIMACPSRPAHVPVYRVEDADQALQMAGFAAFHVLWHHRDMGRYVAQQARGALVLQRFAQRGEVADLAQGDLGHIIDLYIGFSNV